MASKIDHTLLKPEATKQQVVNLCEEAIKFHFKTVCIQPYWVSHAAGQLAGSEVGITTVIGFPLGVSCSMIKALETEEAIAKGASEVDMVLNAGALKSDRLADVFNDVRMVVQASDRRAIVKVILETGALTEAEKKTACVICELAGADFVKTSTGFGPGGATADDVRLMDVFSGPSVQVKASGGIRNSETAQCMIDAGATRLGTSSGIQIVQGEEGTGY
ncbi:deoxyribose-phosphate aldolase [Paenibacillus nasutitermitis]|nr:deoxyribose-phosphate aldolase [Paenibacillus nasutitermitis]